MLKFKKWYAGIYICVVPHKGTVMCTRSGNSWKVIVKRLGKFSNVFATDFDTLKDAKDFCNRNETDLWGDF